MYINIIRYKYTNIGWSIINFPTTFTPYYFKSDLLIYWQGDRLLTLVILSTIVLKNSFFK